jgi:predicted carbohydrate-binding protein with CBM5 and CBM33 domain
MTLRKKVAAAIAALCGVPLAIVLTAASPATSHGSLSDPASRSYTCRFKENPENPTSAACRAAVAAGGTQAFYDWHEVNLANAAGNHRSLIPDGKLCSAGRAKYRGLDLARSDWPATRVTAGSRRLTYHATAPHANGNFTFYITRAGWSPTSPLRWGDLVQIANFTRTPSFAWNVTLPSRTGRHVIYSVWQRNDSPEAFYTCSDVIF